MTHAQAPLPASWQQQLSWSSGRCWTFLSVSTCLSGSMRAPVCAALLLLCALSDAAARQFSEEQMAAVRWAGQMLVQNRNLWVRTRADFRLFWFWFWSVCPGSGVGSELHGAAAAASGSEVWIPVPFCWWDFLWFLQLPLPEWNHQASLKTSS